MSVSLGKSRERWSPPRELRRQRSDGTARFRRWVAHRTGRQQGFLRHCAEQAGQLMEQRVQQSLTTDEVAAELLYCRRAFLRDVPGMRPAERTELYARTLALLAQVMQETLGMLPYQTQLHAALGMYEGCAVQLAPGEGKTLALALAAAMHGWSGKPCHVMTANDYLAHRDAEFLALFYQQCGLSVAVTLPEMQPDELRCSYAADIVYATGKQLLADFLRDSLLTGGISSGLQRQINHLRNQETSAAPVMRGLYAAIVDEADSVLIDEANTPLIISGPDQNRLLTDAVLIALDICDQLQPELHYLLDTVYLDVAFTPAGKALLEELSRSLPPMWQVDHRREELTRQAILARDFFQRDRHFVIHEEKVVIVDEKTGRMMPGRSWSYGLHQAIEAREGLELTQPSRTMARMSFQAYFRLYHRLSGASGTLQGIEGELWKSYELTTVRIPPRLPSRLVVHTPVAARDVEAKAGLLIGHIEHYYQRRIPVLIGSRRISDSEKIAEMLCRAGIPCKILNAKQHEREAEIIADAGVPAAVTVATNMAGRGTDIKIAPGVAEQGGLRVLMYEPHEAGRIDWQMYGRAGRQGAPGEAQMYLTLDDDLFKRFTPMICRPLLWLSRLIPVPGPVVSLLLKAAQWRAQRVYWRQRSLLAKREKTISEQMTFARE